jgi:hypothetical protein
MPPLVPLVSQEPARVARSTIPTADRKRYEHDYHQNVVKGKVREKAENRNIASDASDLLAHGLVQLTRRSRLHVSNRNMHVLSRASLIGLIRLEETDDGYRLPAAEGTAFCAFRKECLGAAKE